MLQDTVIDTSIGVGSYYLASATMSIIVAAIVAGGASVPGVVVVGGTVMLSITYDHLIRTISNYWE